MQNRDKGRSDEDRSRGERSHESMRGNMRQPSDTDRSYQDRSPRTPEGEELDRERSSSVGRRHITGEGESIGESGELGRNDRSGRSSEEIESDGSRSGSRKDFRGTGGEE